MERPNHNLLTAKEVTRRLGISQPVILHHIHPGELPTVQIGSTVRVPEVVVDRLVNAAIEKANALVPA
jgi:excisionase family DNA binding protein